MSYVPDRGDIVWINFSPQSGREQAGRRPALVISPKLANDASKLVFVCPITSKVKSYPFEVPFTGQFVSGAILVNHLKSLDWTTRATEYIETLEASDYQEVEAKLETLIL